MLSQAIPLRTISRRLYGTTVELIAESERYRLICIKLMLVKILVIPDCRCRRRQQPTPIPTATHCAYRLNLRKRMTALRRQQVHRTRSMSCKRWRHPGRDRQRSNDTTVQCDRRPEWHHERQAGSDPGQELKIPSASGTPTGEHRRRIGPDGDEHAGADANATANKPFRVTYTRTSWEIRFPLIAAVLRRQRC